MLVKKLIMIFIFLLNGVIMSENNEIPKINPHFLKRFNPILKTSIVIVIPFILEFKDFIPVIPRFLIASIPLLLLILEMVFEFGTNNIMYIDKNFNRCGYASICKYKNSFYRNFCNIMYFIGINDKNYAMSVESIIGNDYELKIVNNHPALTYCSCLVLREDELSLYIVEYLQTDVHVSIP